MSIVVRFQQFDRAGEVRTVHEKRDAAEDGHIKVVAVLNQDRDAVRFEHTFNDSGLLYVGERSNRNKVRHRHEILGLLNCKGNIKITKADEKWLGEEGFASENLGINYFLLILRNRNALVCLF